MDNVSRLVQRRLGNSLRSRVAGEDAPERAQRIWGTPGPRWFAPEDPVWRVHADASMFAGGIASLLLQSLHPLAMAGSGAVTLLSRSAEITASGPHSLFSS